MVIGALEAGGTKMVCAVGDEYGNIAKRTVFPTQKPDKTMPHIIKFFKQESIEALGIGCFGPLNLDRNSAQYGTITSTPKIEWRQYPIGNVLKKELKVSVAIDTDVNAAALGEATWGAGIGDDVVLYITIGTGVGAGIYIDGKLLHGLVHPEAGHILLTRREDDGFLGSCPYHKNCMEGLVSGPAIKGRWGRSAEELADTPLVWEMEADYIAQALANYILVYSPNRIILGGGVMHQLSLFPMIREKVKEYLNGYVNHPMLEHGIDQYIVPPLLGDDAGIKGALKLAIDSVK
ncbi:MAG: ROK family protein [Clostridium sp.]|nr:ROK family protein [Clostridium sp.]